MVSSSQGLPVPDYGDDPLTDLPARIQALNDEELRALLRYEQEHENRLAVVQIISNQLTTVSGDARASHEGP